jgi:Flp pilus assembly protein TadB
MSEGDRSDILKCTTSSAAPKNAPQQLSVLDAGPTEATVQWVPPERDADEKEISGCVVHLLVVLLVVMVVVVMVVVVMVVVVAVVVFVVVVVVWW